MFAVDEERLKIFAGYLDMAALCEHLNVFEMICNGDSIAGEIAKLDMASRFRWLTATRSTIVQISKHIRVCVPMQKKRSQNYMHNWCWRRIKTTNF